MTHLNYWSDTAKLREPVETTLSQLGYDNGYVGIIKKIFRISQTPVSRQSPYYFLFQDDFCHQPALRDSTYLAYTHTGQEVYPFGQSCLRTLNRVSQGKGALFGSTASNCASTFKVIDLYRRRQQESKQVIVTCDTGFTSILKDIPGSTVTGDARSAVSLDAKSGNYQFVDYQSQVYPSHFGGAWEKAESRSVYEKTYKDRIVELIKSALTAINPNREARIAIVPHNVNVYTWNAIEKKLGNPQLTFFTGGVSDHGHCYGSDVFINLKLLEQLTISGDADFAHPPDFFLCVTAGVGGFFSSITLKRNEADKESLHD